MNSNIGTHDSTPSQGTTYPLTIRQILSSSIQGKSVVTQSNQILETVKIIGKVVQRGDSHNPVAIVTDHTGILKVRIMIRNDIEKEKFESIVLDKYYKFFGFISPGEEFMMVTQGFMEINQDFNEITRHYIASVWTSLVNQGQIVVENPVKKEEVTENYDYMSDIHI